MEEIIRRMLHRAFFAQSVKIKAKVLLLKRVAEAGTAQVAPKALVIPSSPGVCAELRKRPN